MLLSDDDAALLFHFYKFIKKSRNEPLKVWGWKKDTSCIKKISKID